jgi:transcriptional regulator with XRE-family HTH domain
MASQSPQRFLIRLDRDRFNLFLQKKGISRDELARRMGMHRTTLYRVEAGESHPSTEFIARLMKVTGQKFEALFFVEES